jgi:integrase/recombinase XerD
MAKEKVGLYYDKRRSKPWIIRWFGENNERGRPRRYCQAFVRKRDAVAFRSAKQAKLDGGGQRDKLTITLEELCAKFIESRKHSLRKASLDRYGLTISQLKEYFGPTYQIRRICRQDAEMFIATRKIIHPDHKRKPKRLSAGARNRYLSCAHTIFTTAVDWEYINKNPFSGIQETKSVPRAWHFITPDEFKAILLTTSELRVQALYGAMYGAGLRYGEAINLLWNGKDIDFGRSRINIEKRPATQSIPPFLVKDYEKRSVPIPQWVQNMLLKLHTEAPEGCPFAFVSSQRLPRLRKKWQKLLKGGNSDEWENHMVANNVLRNFRAACHRTGIKVDTSLTLHCLRKSYAQNLADNGTPISTLKSLMGHSDIQTTSKFYLQSTDANEERACQALDRIMGVLESDAKMTPKPSRHKKSEKPSLPNSRSNQKLH